MRKLRRHSVLKTIKLDRQFCHGTINIEKIFADGMLTAKLESGKTARAYCVPQLLFFFALLAPEATGIANGPHDSSLLKCDEKASPSLRLSPHSSLAGREG